MLGAVVHQRNENQVAVPTTDIKWPVTMLLWLGVDALAVTSPVAIPRGVRLIGGQNGFHTHPWHSIAANAADTVGTLNDAAVPSGRRRRCRAAAVYSIVSTLVAIAVAARTGGDAHAAAMTKAAVEAGMVLAHHLGRVVAHSTTHPPTPNE